MVLSIHTTFVMNDRNSVNQRKIAHIPGIGVMR